MSTEPFSVETTINYYYTPVENVPPPMLKVGTVGARRMKFDGRKREVFNIRGRENNFKLDRNGFEFLPFPLNEDKKIYDNEEEVKQVLYPKFAQFMKDATGCTSVHVFSHIVRRTQHADAMKAIEHLDDGERTNVGDSPAMFAHVDQSADGAEKLVREIHRRNPDLDGVFRKSQKYRWGIINLWRPLKPISREPLAVCDAQSVHDNDLQEVVLYVPNDYRKPDNDSAAAADDQPAAPYTSLLWQLKPSMAHRWYFPYRMQPDEALLIKCHDSKKDGRTATRAPHTAIQTPLDMGPPRESVEVRCICFWEDEPRDRVGAKL